MRQTILKSFGFIVAALAIFIAVGCGEAPSNSHEPTSNKQAQLNADLGQEGVEELTYPINFIAQLGRIYRELIHYSMEEIQFKVFGTVELETLGDDFNQAALDAYIEGLLLLVNVHEHRRELTARCVSLANTNQDCDYLEWAFELTLGLNEYATVRLYETDEDNVIREIDVVTIQAPVPQADTTNSSNGLNR